MDVLFGPVDFPRLSTIFRNFALSPTHARGSPIGSPETNVCPSATRVLAWSQSHCQRATHDDRLCYSSRSREEQEPTAHHWQERHVGHPPCLEEQVQRQNYGDSGNDVPNRVEGVDQDDEYDLKTSGAQREWAGHRSSRS